MTQIKKFDSEDSVVETIVNFGYQKIGDNKYFIAILCRLNLCTITC